MARPDGTKYIESPEQFLKLWNDYKRTVDETPDVQQVATAKGVQYLEFKRPYLRKGFESYVYNKLGFHIHQYIDNWKDEYADYLGVVTHIRNEWESDQIDGALTGRYKAPNLIARLNNLVERQENTIVTEQPLFPDK